MVTGHLLIRETHRCPCAHDVAHRSSLTAATNLEQSSLRLGGSCALPPNTPNTKKTANVSHVFLSHSRTRSAYALDSICDFQRLFLLQCQSLPGSNLTHSVCANVSFGCFPHSSSRSRNLKSRCFEGPQTDMFIEQRQQYEPKRE